MTFCSRCGRLIGNNHRPPGGWQIGNNHRPPGGWQIEDGSIICQSCAAKDLQRIAAELKRLKESLCSSPAKS